MTLIVNMFGAPGAGKSTIASGVFCLVKLHGLNAEYAQEYAKDVTWEQSTPKLNNQIYVFGKQYHRLWRLLNKVDVVITDSPLLLSVVHSDNDESFVNLVLNEHKKMENINYFINRVKEYNPKGRNETEIESNILGINTIKTLEKYCIIHTSLDGDMNAVNIITADILKHFGKQLRLGMNLWSNPNGYG